MLDQIPNASATAIVLRDQIGGGTDFGNGIGRAYAQASQLHGRNVRNVVADESHLPRLHTYPLAKVQQVFRLVFRQHVQMLIPDAQRTGAVQQALRNPACDDGTRETVVNGRTYPETILGIELPEQIAVRHRQHQPVCKDPVHIERKGPDIFITCHTLQR